MGVLKNRVIYLISALLLMVAYSRACLGATLASANHSEKVATNTNSKSIGSDESPRDKTGVRKCLRIVAEDTHYNRDYSVVVCEGAALVGIDGQDAKMEADTVIYDDTLKMIEGRGHVRIIRKGMLTTGMAFKLRIDSVDYLVTDINATVGEVSIVSRAKIGANKYLSFWHLHIPADLSDRLKLPVYSSQGYSSFSPFASNSELLKTFLKIGVTASKFQRYSASPTSVVLGPINTSLGGTPQFAQYRLGGFFGKGVRVRDFRSFSDLGSSSRMTRNVELRRELYLAAENVASRVNNNNVEVTSWSDYGQVGHIEHGLPILRTVSSSERRGLNVGDFPRRGIGWRCGKAVFEQPYTQNFSQGSQTPINGELPWLF